MESQERDRTNQIRETVDELIRTMRQHHRIVERRVEGLGVHHSQHRMLMKLSRMGRSASQKDLADAMDVSAACVARMLKHLSAEGLVERAGGADARCNEVSVTPKGEKMVQETLEVFRRVDERMFDGISGEQIAALNVALRRVQANLTEMEGREPMAGERREGSV